MTELAIVQNTGTTPVVIDDEGHLLGAGEFAPAAHRTQRVRDLINAGLVGVISDVPERNVDPAYTAAVRALEAREQQERDEAKAAKQDQPKPGKGATTNAQEG